jgi:ABC-type Zn uptake system ZnuABC Zn-binding protein ZnuA
MKEELLATLQQNQAKYEAMEHHYAKKLSEMDEEVSLLLSLILLETLIITIIASVYTLPCNSLLHGQCSTMPLFKCFSEYHSEHA